MINLNTTTPPGGSPPWGLLGIEPLRALLEFAGLHLMNQDSFAQGDGHPVVIFPGLASDSLSTKPLKTLCTKLGYSAYDWGRGLNTGPEGDLDVWLDELSEHVAALTAHHQQPMSLIGWSLGGIYAREVAKRSGVRVRQVITLGSPFAGTGEQNNVGWVYRFLNGKQPPMQRKLVMRLSEAPTVPTTSIYSRTDGVVAWQACIQPGNAPHTENIEVQGSHCGMGWNAEVMTIVADKLRPRTSPPQRG
jgi:pimeloyl-ACP methyl ester carboxylesterase